MTAERNRVSSAQELDVTSIPVARSEPATRHRRRANSDWPPFEFAAGLHLGDGYRTTRVPSLSLSLAFSFPSPTLARSLATHRSKTYPHRADELPSLERLSVRSSRRVATHLRPRVSRLFLLS